MTRGPSTKDEAWAYIEFALGPEGQTIAAETGRTVPSLIVGRRVRRVPRSRACRPRTPRCSSTTSRTSRPCRTSPTWPEIEDVGERTDRGGVLRAERPRRGGRAGRRRCSTRPSRCSSERRGLIRWSRVERERLGLWLMAAPFLVGRRGARASCRRCVTLVMSLFSWDLVQPASVRRARQLPRAGRRRRLPSVAAELAHVRRDRGAAAASRSRSGSRCCCTGAMRASAAERAAVFLPTRDPRRRATRSLWLWILNPLYGPLNLAARALGLPTPSWLSAPASGTMGRDHHGPVPARGRLPDRARRAARGARRARTTWRPRSGAGPGARFARVTLPLMAPGAAAAGDAATRSSASRRRSCRR